MRQAVAESIATKQRILEDSALMRRLEEASELVAASLRQGGKIHFCGNGGSAADAQHLAAELSGRFYYDRPPLNAEALHCNTSYMTAVGNDYGYEWVFARLLRGTGHAGDVLVGLSTSGNSKNILKVYDVCKEMGIVMPVGQFLEGDYETVVDEIQQQKEACSEHNMKVILETGCLKTAKNIKIASLLSMYAGGDYIKTSTGKLEPAATPEAAYVMCQAIKEYYEQTGIQIGFKPAGGLNSVMDALIYYTIVKEVLGEKWLTNKWFRMGTSRLANLLLSEVVGEEVKFF